MAKNDDKKGFKKFVRGANSLVKHKVVVEHKTKEAEELRAESSTDEAQKRVFSVSGNDKTEMLSFRANGDIFVKGILMRTGEEHLVVQAFKQFLVDTGHIKLNKNG